MPTRTAGRVSLIALCAIVLSLGAACGGSPAAPTPVAKTETFTGTLQPLGIDFKTFTITYAQGTSDLSITVNTLSTTANSTPVTGITIGVGVGTVSGAICSLQVQTPVAVLGQELFAPNGASAGTYCVEIYDCPTGATGCTSTLTEPVTYSMTVKHY
jgi:hypothetical protein